MALPLGVTLLGLVGSIDMELNVFKKITAPAGNRAWLRETQRWRPGRLAGGGRTC